MFVRDTWCDRCVGLTIRNKEVKSRKTLTTVRTTNLPLEKPMPLGDAQCYASITRPIKGFAQLLCLSQFCLFGGRKGEGNILYPSSTCFLGADFSLLAKSENTRPFPAFFLWCSERFSSVSPNLNMLRLLLGCKLQICSQPFFSVPRHSFCTALLFSALLVGRKGTISPCRF